MKTKSETQQTLEEVVAEESVSINEPGLKIVGKGKVFVERMENDIYIECNLVNNATLEIRDLRDVIIVGRIQGRVSISHCRYLLVDCEKNAQDFDRGIVAKLHIDVTADIIIKGDWAGKGSYIACKGRLLLEGRLVYDNHIFAYETLVVKAKKGLHSFEINDIRLIAEHRYFTQYQNPFIDERELIAFQECLLASEHCSLDSSIINHKSHDQALNEALLDPLATRIIEVQKKFSDIYEVLTLASATFPTDVMAIIASYDENTWQPQYQSSIQALHVARFNQFQASKEKQSTELSTSGLQKSGGEGQRTKVNTPKPQSLKAS